MWNCRQESDFYLILDPWITLIRFDKSRARGRWVKWVWVKWYWSMQLVEYSSWCHPYLWWHHQMETFSVLLAICAGNSLVPGEFPAQSPGTRRFDVFFDLHLNKRLSKQSWGRWFEMLSRPLWHHRNATTRYFALGTIMGTVILIPYHFVKLL